MDGLILFSHGSLLCGAGQALIDHVVALRAMDRWKAVEVGYMNYSQPTFADSVALLADRGIHRITVVPYFLVPGKFVSEDLARHIERARCEYSNVEFTVAEPFGFDDLLADAILYLAANSRTVESWRTELNNASQFCEKSPYCPLFATAGCPATDGESR